MMIYMVGGMQYRAHSTVLRSLKGTSEFYIKNTKLGG